MVVVGVMVVVVFVVVLLVSQGAGVMVVAGGLFASKLVEQFHLLFHLVLHPSTGNYHKPIHSFCLLTSRTGTNKCDIGSISCSFSGQSK